MNIHYLQHVPFEGLGYIESWLKENNHEISLTRFYEPHYSLPSASEIDALIVMGGPMGVYGTEKHHWLNEEKTLIKTCLQTGKKVLGICLGAQLIADCLGAHINRAQHKEIGWFPVIPTEDCKEQSWFYELFQHNPVVFHWHGDRFEIPAGCLNLLSSEANTNQAFSYNENVIGLQFHLEVTAETITLMVENGLNELANKPHIQNEQAIKNGIMHTLQCNKIMSHILSKWLS